jgi:hypothetical protein
MDIWQREFRERFLARVRRLKRRSCTEDMGFNDPHELLRGQSRALMKA